jgi:hypothetical protein
MTAELVIYGAGHRDPVPLDPAAMAFRAQPAKKGCRGCVFDGQWSPVCKRAGELAKSSGRPDCGDGFIYVAPDKRQMDLLKSGRSSECESPGQPNQNQGE